MGSSCLGGAIPRLARFPHAVRSEDGRGASVRPPWLCRGSGYGGSESSLLLVVCSWASCRSVCASLPWVDRWRKLEWPVLRRTVVGRAYQRWPLLGCSRSTGTCRWRGEDESVPGSCQGKDNDAPWQVNSDPFADACVRRVATDRPGSVRRSCWPGDGLSRTLSCSTTAKGPPAAGVGLTTPGSRCRRQREW